MNEKTKTAKTCSKGHILDPSWKICPYCGESIEEVSPESKKTVREGISPALKKIVREEAALEKEKEREMTSRKTEILKDRGPEISALAWLVALDGPTRATVYQLIKKKTAVGSYPDCDICIEAKYVSGRHASFHFEKGKYYITDLDSANGTFVNQKRVTKKGLEEGDRIKIGDITYAFKYIVL
jgi:hypothetical protein